MTTPPPHEIRTATKADLHAVGRSLASAFDDDPVWRWLITDEARYSSRTSRALAAVASMHLAHDSVWMTETAESVAVWAPPGKHRIGPREFAPVAHRFLPAVGLQGIRRFSTFVEVEKMHPREPHWYLAVLGTDSAHQGRGFASAAMAPALAAADEDGVGCYLESSKERNIPFYERHGFRVTDTFDLAKGKGPRVWLMWRDPQPPGTR